MPGRVTGSSEVAVHEKRLLTRVRIQSEQTEQFMLVVWIPSLYANFASAVHCPSVCSDQHAINMLTALQELTTANERRLFQELQSTKNLVQEQVSFICESSCPAAIGLWPLEPVQQVCLMCDLHCTRNPLTATCTALYSCLHLAQTAVVAHRIWQLMAAIWLSSSHVSLVDFIKAY